MNIYIDSENINSRMFENILTRFHNHSILTTKVFADWTESTSKHWVAYCRQKTSQFIEMIQILKKPKKQSIDFGIIVDILNDVLNDKQTNNAIKHVVIISSDMDYIQLVKMLKKHNINAEIIDSRHERVDMITSDEDKENENMSNYKLDKKHKFVAYTSETGESDDDIDIEMLRCEQRAHNSALAYTSNSDEDDSMALPDTITTKAAKEKTSKKKKKQVTFQSSNERKNITEREKEKYIYFTNCIHQLKKQGVKLISEKKLKSALMRLADTIHERTLFNHENVSFSKYDNLVVKASGANKKWILL